MSVVAGYADFLLGSAKTMPLVLWFVGVGAVGLFGVIWRAFQISLKRRL